MSKQQLPIKYDYPIRNPNERLVTWTEQAYTIYHTMCDDEHVADFWAIILRDLPNCVAPYGDILDLSSVWDILNDLEVTRGYLEDYEIHNAYTISLSKEVLRLVYSAIPNTIMRLNILDLFMSLKQRIVRSDGTVTTVLGALELLPPIVGVLGRSIARQDADEYGRSDEIDMLEHILFEETMALVDRNIRLQLKMMDDCEQRIERLNKAHLQQRGMFEKHFKLK